MAYTNPAPVLYDEHPDATTAISQADDSSDAAYAPCIDMYFSFIDVLGFKQTFDENRENSNTEFASKYKEVFRYFNKLMNSTSFDNNDIKQWNSGQTSDSLYFYTNRVDYLAAFIKLFSHFSLYAMSKDVFFRGGIAKGNLYIEKPYQFYGDCVIKAYLLENTIAQYPRIVLDNATCEDLKTEKASSDYITIKSPPDRSYINPFINISEYELHSLTGISVTDFCFIDKGSIRKYILENMNRFEFDDKNYRKYAFLKKEYETATGFGIDDDNSAYNKEDRL